MTELPSSPAGEPIDEVPAAWAEIAGDRRRERRLLWQAAVGLLGVGVLLLIRWWYLG